MKVLVLSCATYADPATRSVWQRVAARGVDVTLVLPRRIKHSFGPAVVPDTPYPTPGVRLVKLDTWISHHNGTHVVMRGLPRLIRETRPDIIHCVMEPWSITCLQTLLCISRTSPRPVFGVQAAETRPEQGNLLTRSVRQWLYRSVLSRCDYLIGWSGPVIRAAARLGLNGQPTSTAPAVGVDTDLFRPAEAGEKESIRAEMDLGTNADFLVGFVGRFVEEKGIQDLIAAADLATASAPNLKLALLGAGPLRSDLVAAARTRPWMRLVERMDQQGVARFLRALDLLVLPSRTTMRSEEQFGMVLVEAMSSGVPVIGSTCGAIPEVIDESGWVYPEADISRLHQTIVHAVCHSGDMSRLRTLCRDRARVKFSDDAVAHTLVSTWGAQR